MNGNHSLSSALSSQTVDKLDRGLTAAERTTERLADDAVEALNGTKRRATQALDALSSSVDELRQAVPSALHRAADEAAALSNRALRSARHAREAALDNAERLGRQTRGYIREEPVKSVVLAAAAGAVVYGLISFFSRSRR